jgi:hypothetical protein
LTKAEAHCRITNEVTELANADRRTVIGTRFRDVCAAIVSNMGGVDHCSEARLQLARRFSALAQQMEAALAKGERPRARVAVQHPDAVGVAAGYESCAKRPCRRWLSI